MRSRNGNCPFVFTSLALICALTHGADHYYIGYRLALKNTRIINETLTLSKAMKPCGSEISAPLTLKMSPDESLYALLERERNLFLEYALEGECRVKSNDLFTTTDSQTLQTMILPTKCYAVEFNGDFVTITLTK